MKKSLLVIASSALLLSACNGGSGSNSNTNWRAGEKRDEVNLFTDLSDETKGEELCDKLASYVAPVVEALKKAKGHYGQFENAAKYIDPRKE